MRVLKRLAVVIVAAIALAQLEVAIFPFRAMRGIYDVLFWIGIFSTPIFCLWAAAGIKETEQPLARAVSVFAITCGSTFAVLFVAVESGALILWLCGNWSLKLVA